MHTRSCRGAGRSLTSAVLLGVACATLYYAAADDTEPGANGQPSASPTPSLVGVCMPYRGRVCAPYGRANDTVFVPNPLTAAVIEERVRAALRVIANSPDLTQECAEYAAPAVCLSAFPPCDLTAPRPSPLPACRDECEYLRDLICKREYAIARAHALIGQKVALPVCEKLPAVRGDSAATSCRRLHVRSVTPPLSQQTCYHGNGENYLGTVGRAASGRLCIPWSEYEDYSVLSKRHPGVMGGHSYCRNPVSSGQDSPWCYTEARLGQPPRAELCDVSRCAAPILQYIVLPGVGTAVLLCVLGLITGVCWCLCCRRRAHTMSVVTKLADSTDPELIISEKLPLKSNQQPDLEVQLSQLQFKEELGEGAFGKVYVGELQLLGSCAPVPVAIKTLKKGASSCTQRDFTREWRLMAELQHSHIVRLLAVVTKATPACMVFERMAAGDLHQLLVDSSPRLETRKQVLGEVELVDIAAQVADGMSYLADHHYVHRDLAARNCLVGDKRIVKITDFGLSRDIYSSDYYRLNTRALLPVRWMPPESILYGKFTTESDVWSYGVLLWELFSFGLQPYYGYSSAEVVEMVTRRQLLPRPDDAPAAVYDLMLDCWHQTPCRRPLFAQILHSLRRWQPEHRDPTAPTAGAGVAAGKSSQSSLNRSSGSLASSVSAVRSDMVAAARPAGHVGSVEGLSRATFSPAGRGSASLPRPAPSGGNLPLGVETRKGGATTASLPRPSALAAADVAARLTAFRGSTDTHS